MMNWLLESTRHSSDTMLYIKIARKKREYKLCKYLYIVILSKYTEKGVVYIGA